MRSNVMLCRPFRHREKKTCIYRICLPVQKKEYGDLQRGRTFTWRKACAPAERWILKKIATLTHLSVQCINNWTIFHRHYLQLLRQYSKLHHHCRNPVHIYSIRKWRSSNFGIPTRVEQESQQECNMRVMFSHTMQVDDHIRKPGSPWVV